MPGHRLPLCCLLALGLLCCAWGAEAKPLKIIAGTSLIEDIAKDLTGGRSEILTIIQGSSCPGHENVKTSDFIFAAGADILLIHSFQRRMPQLTGMLDAVANKRLRVAVLDLHGSWLVPETQKEAVRRIAAALAELAPGQARDIARRARARLEKVDRARAESLAKLAAVKGKAVAAADMQAEFVAWAGLKVLRTYRRAEDLSARDMASLIDALRGGTLCGVIDNYQSGPEAGLPLALELKVRHVVLSNFPGSSPDVPDYFSLLRVSVEQLARL